MATEQESDLRARVFLSYCHADPNADVVRSVQTAIASKHDVFCDVSLEPGVPWGPEIEARLDEADYFVVFLSAEAAKSKPLTEEARRAVKRQEETGRPRIIPVPLAYDVGDLGLELGALLKPFQGVFFWQTPEDTSDLIDDLESVFSGAWVAPAAEIAPALSRYLVSVTRKTRIREVFVPPADVQKARDSIRSGQILWITGAVGAGKHFLASVLACELNKPVFELRRTLSWRHIYQHRPAKSVLVLPDALVFERAGAGDYEAELSALRQICETDNAILLTCSDEEYTTRNSDLIDAGFTPDKLTRYRLSDDAYSLPLRSAIVRNLVRQSHPGIVSSAQSQWIDKLLASQPLPWKDWTLGELESFVTLSLPTTTSLTEIVQLLDRHATVEDQVHVWFLGLDEVARSLLLTLILFPETTSEQIWVRFRALLSELETLRLVPQMSIPTLGVCRARCDPYVTQTDDLDIVDSDVASAIAREFAVSWREYVIELRPLLTRWALPPAGQDRALTRSGSDESAAVRQRVARLLGELLKVRVEDVLPFLEDFATFEQSAVRRSAAEAVVYAFSSEEGARNCRKLLREWEADRSDANASVRKREVAADASWRIAALSKGSGNYEFALEQLQRQVRDIPRVRAVVAYGIGRIVSRRHTDELLPLIIRLARDQDEIVRRRTGVAISELARREPKAADAILADLIGSDDTRRLWTAAYALLVASRSGKGDRDKLLALMHLDPSAFAGALASSMTPGDEAKDTDKTEYATRNLFRLAANAESAERFTTVLEAYWTAHPDRAAQLCDRLGRLASKSVNDLLVEGDERRLLKMTSVSQLQEAVLIDAGAGGQRKQITMLAVIRIISKWTDESQPVPKVGEAWEQEPNLFERFLQFLRSDLGDVGRNAAVLLRYLILESLFENSAELALCAASWLRTTDISDEAKDTIEVMMKSPRLRAGLVRPLSLEYWGLRSRSSLGDAGRDAFVLLRRVILESLFENPEELVSCAASWQSTPGTASETKDAIHAIIQAYELRGSRPDASADDAGRRAVVLLSSVFLESLLRTEPKELIKCAATWLMTPGISDEAKEAIRAIVKAPESQASLVATLSAGYWGSRSEVWLILDSLDSRSSIAVREKAFARMLRYDPSWFIAAAIQETQDIRQVKDDVLKALAQVARTNGTAIVAAVRVSVSQENRGRILTLINDFRESDAPLKKVADRLWSTRIWLSFLQILPGSSE